MSWQSIRGQNHVVQFFQNAYSKQRLGHAYLFVGPAGVGKKTLALELGKAFLCETKKDALEACERCSACQLVHAGTHPDLFQFARPEESVDFPISVVREVLTQMAMKPMRGSRKIAILDDAADMNDEAANAFLKTLEEPPAGSTLILIGAATPEGMLPTILSRCQIVRFAPLSLELLDTMLQEQEIADPQVRFRLARLAGGSIGQALALNEESLWNFRNQLLKSLLQEPPDSFAISTSWNQFIEEAGKEGATQRRRASLSCKLLVDALQSALRISVDAQPANIEKDEAELLTQLARKLGTETLLRWMDRTLEADRQIDRKVQLVLILEALVDRLCHPTVTVPRVHGLTGATPKAP